VDDVAGLHGLLEQQPGGQHIDVRAARANAPAAKAAGAAKIPGKLQIALPKAL